MSDETLKKFVERKKRLDHIRRSVEEHAKILGLEQAEKDFAEMERALAREFIVEGVDETECEGYKLQLKRPYQCIGDKTDKAVSRLEKIVGNIALSDFVRIIPEKHAHREAQTMDKIKQAIRKHKLESKSAEIFAALEVYEKSEPRIEVLH